MRGGTPERFKEENDRIAEAFLNSDREMEDLIQEMASPEFKAWMAEERERIADLRKRGVLV